jgi:hypothetical protein
MSFTSGSSIEFFVDDAVGARRAEMELLKCP